jgi:hypothetical protein
MTRHGNHLHVAELTLLGLLLAAPARADVPVRNDIIRHPTPGRFSVCHGGGCATLDTVGLSHKQWRTIRGVFQPPSTTPAQERRRIARAVGLMETFVGPLTGTAHDRPETFHGIFHAGQMDCIDESTNTTEYLTLLADQGLLRWHTVEDRATRLPSLWSWPHTTAVIRDRETGAEYAVDSWFRANGKPPYIVPLARWRDGWRPTGH